MDRIDFLGYFLTTDFFMFYFKFMLMNKEIIKIIIKVVIYALGLIAAYLGVTSLSSCTYSRSTVGDGRAVIITHDTTIIKHQGVLKTK